MKIMDFEQKFDFPKKLLGPCNIAAGCTKKFVWTSKTLGKHLQTI